MNKETLKFLRNYFSIPASKKIGWGIIEYKIFNGPTQYKPGVYIEGSDLYLDIAARRFFKNGDYPHYRIHPATRKAERSSYRYTAKQNPEISIVRSKTYISDIFYPAIYSQDLETDEFLL